MSMAAAGWMNASPSTAVITVVLIIERLLCCSDTAKPVIAIVFPIAAAPAADHAETVDDLDFLKIFRHLVTELALDPHPQRRAVLDRKGLAVHAIGQDR